MHIGRLSNTDVQRRQGINAVFSSIVQLPKSEATTLGWGKAKKGTQLKTSKPGDCTLADLCFDNVVESLMKSPDQIPFLITVLSPDIRLGLFQKLCEQVHF